jgi:aryl-alcohol dehydrogenase-like predicted oxidoreductase
MTLVPPVTAKSPSRREVLATTTAAAAATALPAWAQAGPVLTKPIPHTGEQLPVVGIGTAVIFDFPATDSVKLAERRAVIENMIAGGAKVIDTAPSYGNAEVVVGELTGAPAVRGKLFLATKVSGGDRAKQTAEMRQSQQRMKTPSFDLMQWWNVRDANTDLGLLREWKAQGICRYVGVTTSFDDAYDAVAQTVRREKPDFLQINYSLGDRMAEDQLLPLAQEVGAAVLTNLPFGRNRMFAAVQGKSLPDWAKEIDVTSWAQLFLKFLISHPAVTCVIPGTDQPRYIIDNLGAGRGRMPDAAMRKRIVDYWATNSG